MEHTMSINLEAIEQVKKWLGTQEAITIVRMSNNQQRLENYWRRKLQNEFNKTLDRVLKELEKTGTIDSRDIDFEDFFMEQSLSTMGEGLKSLPVTTGKQNDPALQPAPNDSRLSKAPPSGYVPKSFKELMELWDKWRKQGTVGRRQRVLANRVKHEYIKKVQSVWDRHGEEFREGNEASRNEVIRKIRQATRAPYARAKTIVETETTYYYNKVRRDVYDESKDVTHYLFVAIRDHRTTEWCNDRHGLVYAKDDPLLQKETPPIHWNCRSEIIPLTPLNPRHLLLIQNPSLQRRNHSCKALPPGWNRAA